MKIAVCIKQVPAKDAPLIISADGAWVEEGDLSYETCEPDDYALEAGLQLKEAHGGEVVAISLGPDRVKQALKTALAKGADRAIHIGGEDTHRLDPLHIGTALAGPLRDESFDLILTGLQSDDHGFGQTGAILAALLDLPHATVVVDLGIVDDGIRVKRELEGGWFQDVTMPLPAVLTIQSGINKPRYANMRGIIAAKKKEIRGIALADTVPGEIGASQQLGRLFVPETSKETVYLEGSPDEIAAALVGKLTTEEHILP